MNPQIPVTTEPRPERPPPRPAGFFERNSDGWAYAKALLVVLACTVVAWLMRDQFAEANLVMVYLLGIVLIAARFGRGPSILASVVSVAAFDFFFAHPYNTFAVSDVEYLVTFAIMLVVGLVISTLTYRLRYQVQVARERELRAAALYALSRDLASMNGIDSLLHTATRHIAELFDSRVAVFLPDRDKRLRLAAAEPVGFRLDGNDLEAAHWAYEHARPAGRGTESTPAAGARCIPLLASQGALGILALAGAEGAPRLHPEQAELLETFAAQTALALERARFSAETEQSRIQIESEQLRNVLLSSVSHDLRTPLAAITGAASTLLEERGPDDATTRRELVQSIYDEAHRLNRLVGNLLDMTRLESGGVQVRKEWYSMEELVGSALSRLDAQLGNRPVRVRLAPDLSLVPLDDVLVEQVLINILENAVKYTPDGSPIELTVRLVENAVHVTVADRGAGIDPGEESRIFGKFYRGKQTGRQGAGLGLAISRAIVEAHGGTIWAENPPGGGSAFHFTLPTGEAPPEVAEEVILFQDSQ